jgi:hypothetical protein
MKINHTLSRRAKLKDEIEEVGNVCVSVVDIK